MVSNKFCVNGSILIVNSGTLTNGSTEIAVASTTFTQTGAVSIGSNERVRDQ